MANSNFNNEAKYYSQQPPPPAYYNQQGATPPSQIPNLQGPFNNSVFNFYRSIC